MTLPYERTLAVNRTPEAIMSVVVYGRRRAGQKMAHVPVELLENLAASLRHYPTRCDMMRAAHDAPTLFGPDGYNGR